MTPALASAFAPPDFAEVYDAQVDFVWSMLRRLGIAEAELPDATQDVFVVIHRRLGSFRGESSLKTWVGGVVLRVATDYRRARRRRPSEPLEAVQQTAAPDPGPHESAEAAQAWARLEALLDTLDEDQRAVFVLVELEELTAPEAADVVGAPLNTVYSRLRLARAKLRAALEVKRGEA